MQSARQVFIKPIRPSTLAKLRRTLSINSRTTPSRTFRSMADRQPFFSQSLRPALRTRSALDLLFGRSYSGGPDAFTPNHRPITNSIWVLITLNTAVFGAWQYADIYKDRNLTQHLYDNFTLSEQNLKAGRYWTLLTSAFSHMNFMHFAFNMFTLNAFGSIMAFVPGVAAIHVWTLAIGSGIAGSVGWLWHRNQVAEKKAKKFNPFGIFGEGRVRTLHVALGASGAVMGMGACATLLMPFAPMNLMFIPIPIPLWILTAGYFAIDTYYLDNDKTGIGHSAHLAGAVYGFVYYFAYLRKFSGVWQMLRRRR